MVVIVLIELVSACFVFVQMSQRGIRSNAPPAFFKVAVLSVVINGKTYERSGASLWFRAEERKLTFHRGDPLDSKDGEEPSKKQQEKEDVFKRYKNNFHFDRDMPTFIECKRQQHNRSMIGDHFKRLVGVVCLCLCDCVCFLI
jgi:hypothetical protein